TDKLHGRILTPDGLRLICAGLDNDPEKIGISDLQPETEIDELLFFHLSRRLHGTEYDVSGRNLENLFTTGNALSDFLRLCS
ncbi:MAG: hypothetical protein IKS59_03310, partial [Aeriscardovia sp.]|nr:hypothetical protein [Aeriscardovia sp.]